MIHLVGEYVFLVVEMPVKSLPAHACRGTDRGDRDLFIGHRGNQFGVSTDDPLTTAIDLGLPGAAGFCLLDLGHENQLTLPSHD